jgi:uncharacterized protein (DUF2147 family)
MYKILSRYLAASPFLLIAAASSALAAADPIGTWVDHTGRGAVEISPCNGSLCGRIVWLKSAGDQEACGIQVIGNARPVAGGKWDGGWIYDPEANAKYDVELTPLGDNKLKVLGYAGTKMFGETMMWTRAPADLMRCDQSAAVTPEAKAPGAQGGARGDAQGESRQPEPTAPPAAVQPERETNAGPSDSRTRQSSGQAKECSIKIGGIGEFTFPCPR